MTGNRKFRRVPSLENPRINMTSKEQAINYIESINVHDNIGNAKRKDPHPHAEHKISNKLNLKPKTK